MVLKLMCEDSSLILDISSRQYTIKYHSMMYATIISMIDYNVLTQDSNIILYIITMFVNKHLHIKELDRYI